MQWLEVDKFGRGRKALGCRAWAQGFGLQIVACSSLSLMRRDKDLWHLLPCTLSTEAPVSLNPRPTMALGVRGGGFQDSCLFTAFELSALG